MSTVIATPERGDLDIIDSASITALMRALLSDADGRRQNPDYLAKHFVRDRWSEYLKNPENAREEFQVRFPGGMYYHLLRTKAFDAVFSHFIEQKSQAQVVILGSGFDSRALRFRDQLSLKNVRVFEVDLQGMLDHKRKIIEQHALPDDRVIYVPCNFQRDSFLEKLFEFGLEPHKPTLVLWEGVTYFLTHTQIDNSMRDMSSLSELSVDVYLDYAFKSYIDGSIGYYGAKELKKILLEINEPHHFGLEPDNVEQFFLSRGYALLANYTSQMLEAKFLRDGFGVSVGQPHTFHGFAHLRTRAGLTPSV